MAPQGREEREVMGVCSKCLREYDETHMEWGCTCRHVVQDFALTFYGSVNTRPGSPGYEQASEALRRLREMGYGITYEPVPGKNAAPFCAGRAAVAHERTEMAPTVRGWRCPICGENQDFGREATS